MSLRIDGLRIMLGSHEIVREASFQVAPGSSLAISGRSGSGKTTLLHGIAGLRPAAEGTVRIAGSDWTVLTEAEKTDLRRSIGFMFQSAWLFEEMSVVDNIAWVGRLRGLSRSEALAEARSLVDRLGLNDRRDAPSAELSGGEAQRVNLARSVIGYVSVLLVDEPTAALDESNAHDVCQMISEFTSERGLCTVVVSHDPLIRSYTSQSLTMREGVLGRASVGY